MSYLVITSISLILISVQKDVQEFSKIHSNIISLQVYSVRDAAKIVKIKVT